MVTWLRGTWDGLTSLEALPSGRGGPHPGACPLSLCLEDNSLTLPRGPGGSGRPHPLSWMGGWGLASGGRADLSCRWLSRLPSTSPTLSHWAKGHLGSSVGGGIWQEAACCPRGWGIRTVGRAARGGEARPCTWQGRSGILGVPGEDACLLGWGLRPAGHQASRSPLEMGPSALPPRLFSPPQLINLN